MKDLFKKYNKPALAIATFVAFFHALWAVLVAVGIGQAYLDWIFPMHFIGNIYTVIDFSIVTAVLLTITAFIATYIAVMIFAVIWKIVMKRK